MSAIIDLVLLGILAICIWTGYKKGLLMGLGGILVIIIGIYGANLLANLFAYDLVPALRPFVSGYTESMMTDDDSEVLKELGLTGTDYSMDDLFARNPERRAPFAEACYSSLGINEETAARMAERTVLYADEAGAGMRDAIVHILCETLGYVACFVLAFLLIVIVLTVIGNLPNLSFKIPQLDLLNDIGGAVVGLVTGLMFCVLLVWALKFMGILIRGDTLPNAILGGWLLRWDPLQTYLGL